MKKLTRGFTLIELLVVIAIIGILSSVVLASLSTAREKARDARRISDLKQIQLALELYADSNNGQYPMGSVGLAALETGGYLPSVPVPPTGTTATTYYYTGVNTGCTGYHIGAELEDDQNAVLPGANFDSSGASGPADDCDTGTPVGFNGADAGAILYDLTN